MTPDPSFILRAVLNVALAVVLPKRQRLYPVLITGTTADLAYLAQLSADGKLKTKLDTKVPFEKAPESWKTSIEGHVTGKVVVVMEK